MYICNCFLFVVWNAFARDFLAESSCTVPAQHKTHQPCLAFSIVCLYATVTFFCGTAVPYRSISENRVSTSEIREMGRRGRAVKVFPSMREFRKRKGLPLFFFLLSALPLSRCARHAFSRTLWAGTARENSGKWISRNIPRRRAGPLQMKDTLFLLVSFRNAREKSWLRNHNLLFSFLIVLNTANFSPRGYLKLPADFSARHFATQSIDRYFYF